MILSNVGILAADSSRTRAYLEAFRDNALIPSKAIYLSGNNTSGPPDLPIVPYFDNSTPSLQTLKNMAIPTDVISTKDVNSPNVVSAVQDSGVEVLIYSGTGGSILRRDLFDTGKKFLHVHPGLVPNYRGSTTVYYSLLANGHCGVSAMFLNEKIDEGDILDTRIFPPPNDRTCIDYGYDPYIRSVLLVQVLQNYLARGTWSSVTQRSDIGKTYFIIHPVLKHMAILSKYETNEVEEVPWEPS